jgi:Uma2 family endonuclease
MATAIQIPLSEYLETIYRPDREYVDGELRERNVGKWDHARVQALLAAWFVNHEAQWGIMAGTEQRMLIPKSAIRSDVRIPDVVVVLAGDHPPTLTEPPLLVIEVLSPEDSYSETQERARDYQQMGVEMVWIVDPKTLTGRMCHGNQWTEARRLEVPGTPLYVDLDEIFRQVRPGK